MKESTEEPSFPPAMAENDAWFGRLGETYNMLWKMVIRPPRDLYNPEELGPVKFRLGKRVYERHDLQLQSSRGKLECSHFVPATKSSAKPVVRPCVIYLHGNCSSRLEAFDALPVLLPRDLTVFCLDLSGSGRSEGEYISLGHHEEKDLAAALQYLRAQENVGAIGLWGRSMGATTSILRAAEDHDLAASVLDSAFADLKMVAEELVNRGRFPIPHFLVGWALELVRNEVSSRAEFDPLHLAPIKSAKLAVCPAFFGVASDDSFVLPHHTQDLHDAWKGERSLRVFEGGHNGVRPTWFLEEAADFLAERLGAKPRTSAHDMVGTETTKSRASTSSQDAEDKGTPRLVSPLTERLHLDADSGAGPAVNPKKPSSSSSSKVGGAKAPRVQPSCEAAQRCEAEDRRRPSQPPRPPTKGGFSGGRLGPGASLAQQLRYLGFNEAECELASRRCLTLEAAMEWLTDQRVTVHL